MHMITCLQMIDFQWIDCWMVQKFAWINIPTFNIIHMKATIHYLYLVVPHYLRIVAFSATSLFLLIHYSTDPASHIKSNWKQTLVLLTYRRYSNFNDTNWGLNSMCMCDQAYTYMYASVYRSTVLCCVYWTHLNDFFKPTINCNQWRWLQCMRSVWPTHCCIGLSQSRADRIEHNSHHWQMFNVHSEPKRYLIKSNQIIRWARFASVPVSRETFTNTGCSMC